MIPAIRHIEARFTVWRGDSPNDLTRFLTRARIDLGDVSTVGTGASGGDGTAATAEFVLANDRPASEGLHPSARSQWNQPSPLLNPNRRVTLEVRITPEGEPAGQWIEVFDGLLGDSVRVSEKASTVTLKARDFAKVLQDHYFETDTVYEGRIDLVMQMMLDDELGTAAPVIHVPAIPTFFVEPYIPQFGTLWDALQQLALQVGWYLGYRRQSAGGHRLVFMDPPREKSIPDWLFDGSGVITADIDRSDRDVRNAVIVWYTDATTRERTRFPTTGALIDAASITEVGARKLMVLEQGSTSQIDTASEAQALAQRALHDLAYQFEGTQVELPISPELRVFDMIGISVDAIDTTQRLFAVNNLQHAFDFNRGTARTTISGSSRVIGKRKQWLNTEARPGSPNDPAGPHQSRLLAPRVTLQVASPGFTVVVDDGRARGVRAAGVEVHWSTTNGFTPSGDRPGEGTCKARGTQDRFTFDNVTDARHYIRVRVYDEDDEPGPYSNQQSIIPGKVEGEWLVVSQNTAFHGGVAVVGGDSNGTLLFYRGSIAEENLVLAIGEVGNLFGAPANAVGIAGEAGSGAWFKGTPRVLDAGSVAHQFSELIDLVAFQSYPYSIFQTADKIGSPFTVPAGKKWILQASVSEYYVNSNPPSLVLNDVRAYGRYPGGGESTIIPAGTYSGNITFFGQLNGLAVRAAASAGASARIRFVWQVIEVDA